MEKQQYLTEKEVDEITKLMTACGFHLSDSSEIHKIMGGISSLHFTIGLTVKEREAINNRMGKNHFEPMGWRGVSVFKNYTTSHVRGSYRAYRGRRVTHDYDTANIFAYSGNGNDNPVMNTLLWLEKYSKLEYNNEK